jgi:ABC-type multidrug transport system fused ATPase/permease subunit
METGLELISFFIIVFILSTVLVIGTIGALILIFLERNFLERKNNPVSKSKRKAANNFTNS